MSTPRSRLPLENRVLLQCLRLDDLDAAVLRDLLTAPPDWARLRDLALMHSVLPLVYTRLRDLAADLVPRCELSALRSQFVYNGQRNLRLARRLLTLLPALAGQGIEVLALKGPALAIQAYGDLALRDFADLDLLIPRSSLTRTLNLLAQQGYVPTPALGTPAANDKLKADSELHLLGGDVHLDVHWQPVERYFPLSVDMDLWRANSESVELLGRSVRTLAPEDGLLYLAINGVRDGWCTLKTVVDMAYLSRVATTAAHQRLWDQASRIGARRMLALGFTLAQRVVGVDLPEETLQHVRRDDAVMALADEAEARLTLELADGADTYALFRRSRERWRDRVACRLTPGPRDWAVIELPPALAPLYYVIRPLRLAAALLGRACNAARRLLRRPS